MIMMKNTEKSNLILMMGYNRNSCSDNSRQGYFSLCIRFDKINGFIKSLDGKIKHLMLFDYGLFNKNCDKTKYFISKKSGITNSINHNFRKVRIDSNNVYLLKKY